MSIAAYQQTIAETEDPRRIEYRIFLRITVQLERYLGASAPTEELRSAPTEELKSAPTEELKSALWRNQEFWSALRADLMSSDNALPGALKAGLVSLSFAVDRHTVRVLDGSADVRLLVDVNRSVMQGLQGILPAGTEMAHGA